MTWPVAMIPYTNMAPYRRLGPPPGCHFVPCVPSASVDALESGRVLAAAVPVGGLAALAGMVEPLGPYGIAAKERSMSVLLFSDRPFSEMHAPATVWLTGESESSVRLLFLLLGLRHGFDRLPLATPDPQGASAELIIGDAALRRVLKDCRPAAGGLQYACGPERTFVTDLAREWYALQGLPFVFARWVIRRDAPADARRSLVDWLDRFGRRESQLVSACTADAAAQLGVDPSVITEYFRVIRRRLTDEDLAGQARFQAALEKHTRRPLFPPASEA